MNSTSPDQLRQHVIIAGYGLPGRAVAEALDARHVDYCVLERNIETVSRCARVGVHIVEGDVTDPEVLKRAHIETASVLVIAIPDEEAALAATRAARQLNPHLKILSRAHYVSVGMESRAAGADEVVVEEKIVAIEMSRILGKMLD